VDQIYTWTSKPEKPSPIVNNSMLCFTRHIPGLW